jgi:DNA polymerase delta subunit 3
MLYEFHRKQNSKKPGSVHATYLISGIRPSAAAHATETQQDGEDSTMRSSPPLPSSSFQQPEDEEVDEVIHTRTIMVVAEEHLDEARAQFDAITGVHIYSLQSRGLSDFQSLTECNRKIVAESASEDSLKDWKVYGVIQNSAVRRRSKPTGRPLPAPKKEEPKKVDPAKDKPTANLSKQISTASNASTKSAAAEPSKTMAKPSASKNESTSIFKSFAKTVAKPKKSESQPNSAAASPVLTPQQPDDVPMTGFSEDEDDDEDSGLPEETQDDKLPEGKTKKDRKAELEAMMDQEDEPMEDAPTPAEEQEEAAVEEQPKETVTVENGRRRGRRRVMKKKTVKDEEGYLGKCHARCDKTLTNTLQ